jgi:hypothetical protein
MSVKKKNRFLSFFTGGYKCPHCGGKMTGHEKTSHFQLIKKKKLVTYRYLCQFCSDAALYLSRVLANEKNPQG